MSKVTVKAVDIVRDNWGVDAPAWVQKLAAECDRPGSSQKMVAGRMARSAALVNLVLKNRYTGRMDRVETIYRRVFEERVCMCPILGSIKPEECLKQQKKPYDGSNHQAVALFRACRTCPFSTIKDGGKDAG